MSKPSAEKRHRQSLKRRQLNRGWKKKIRSVEKSLLEKIGGGKAAEAAIELRKLTRLLSRAASRGVFHKKKASRKISRLSRRLTLAAAKST